MSMPAAAKNWTQYEVREMQDASRPWPRYELLDGELLVTPGPAMAHQRMVGKLHLLLSHYLREHPVGEVLLSPADIELDSHTVLQPDVFVVPSTLSTNHWRDVTALLLAIEVLSPSSIRHDRVMKRRYFQRQRVPEYWIVDVDGRLIERWRPDDERPEILTESLEWRPDERAPALVIELPALFARAPH
jgi:Uma2 family endonuclease